MDYSFGNQQCRWSLVERCDWWWFSHTRGVFKATPGHTRTHTHVHSDCLAFGPLLSLRLTPCDGVGDPESKSRQRTVTTRLHSPALSSGLSAEKGWTWRSPALSRSLSHGSEKRKHRRLQIRGAFSFFFPSLNPLVFLRPGAADLSSVRWRMCKE